MLNARTLLIIAIIAIGASASTYFFLQPEPVRPNTSEGVTTLMVSQNVAKPAYSLHILFIGNSYTFFNAMPNMLVQMAATDPQNNMQFNVQAVTRGGIGLKELWDDGKALKQLKAKHWDYVVLQEQSFWAMFPDSVHNTTRVARQFNEEIQKIQARTLVFATWPRQPGTFWYTDEKYSFLRDPTYMLRQFDQHTKELAQQLGAVAIPVGDYWVSALTNQPAIPLYYNDGSHPGPAGSYLAALVFYRYLTGHTPDRSTYVPDGVTPEQATALKKLVRW